MGLILQAFRATLDILSNIGLASMRSWQASDAKQNFGRLIEAAQDAPQLLMRHSDSVGVVLSMTDYQRLREQADAEFARFILASPFEPSDFDPGMSARLGDG